MQLTISITGTKELRRKMDRLGGPAGLADLSRAMQEIGNKAADYYQSQGFLSQGGVFGDAWPALSRSYALRKARSFPGRPPLVKSGKMLSGFRYEATATQVVIGNRMPYFKYHQSTKVPRRKIPRRAMMGINAPIRMIVQTAVQKDVTDKLRRA